MLNSTRKSIPTELTIYLEQKIRIGWTATVPCAQLNGECNKVNSGEAMDHGGDDVSRSVTNGFL